MTSKKRSGRSGPSRTRGGAARDDDDGMLYFSTTRGVLGGASAMLDMVAPIQNENFLMKGHPSQNYDILEELGRYVSSPDRPASAGAFFDDTTPMTYG
jgi:hypothetical protein